ncbi:MAG: hypothetical protein H6825_16790 [Planctomycetes bacterium]|nr:hypothetical protein [Planctomycetota bacterium]
MTDHDQDHEALMRRRNREGMESLSPRERHALFTCPECSVRLERLQQSIGELMDFADMHRTGDLELIEDAPPPPPPREARPPAWMNQSEGRRPRDWSVVIAVMLVAIVLAAAAIVI